MTHQYPSCYSLLLRLLICAVVAVAGCLVVAPPAFALQPNVGTQQLDSAASRIGLTGVDPRVFIARLVQIILGVMATLFVVLILLAGYWLLTAAGNTEHVERAKKTMVRAVTGLIIVLISYSITTFIKNALTVLEGGGPPVPAGPGNNPDLTRCCVACNRTDSSGACNFDTLSNFGRNSRVTWVGLYTIPNSSQACRALPPLLNDRCGPAHEDDDGRPGRCVVNEVTDPRCAQAIPHPPIP